MEGAVNLVLSISQTKPEYLPKLIEALDEHQAFTSLTGTQADSIISILNSLLNAHTTRYSGLALLNAFVSQCSNEMLEEKGGLWVTLCTRACNQKNLLKEVSMAYQILRTIIARSQETQQFNKLLTSSLLSKVLESCVGHGDDLQYQIIVLLELCLKLYPGPSGTHRQTIQKVIAPFIDSTDIILVYQSAKCQLLLQQARGGGVQGVSLKDSWAQYQLQLIGSIHECFDLMFSNTVETCDTDIGTERLNIPRLNLSDEPITKASQLATRCGNLIKHLEIALSEPFPVSKAVQPARILNLINRGLNVNCLTIAKNMISDNIAIGMLLPELHVKLLSLVNSMSIILGSNLLPYCRQIIKLGMLSLKWTDSGESFSGKRPYILVRIAAYDVLIKWCQMSKSGSTIESVVEQLVKYILKDSTPYENEITLQVLPGSRKYLSKKARKRLHNAHNDSSNIGQKHSNVQKNKSVNNDSGNEKLCAKALECLSEILKAAGCFIKPNVHKILQDHIILLAITTTSSTTKLNLYMHSSCRRYLYDSFKNLVMCAHHLAPPPVQYALEIISIAQIRDSSSLVRNHCATYIHDLEKLVHPNKDCLYFPIDKNELKNIKYSASNVENGKISINGVLESEDEEEDSDMRLILSQSSASSEMVNNLEFDDEREKQIENPNSEWQDQNSQKMPQLIELETTTNDKENANVERGPETSSIAKTDTITIDSAGEPNSDDKIYETATESESNQNNIEAETSDAPGEAIREQATTEIDILDRSAIESKSNENYIEAETADLPAEAFQDSPTNELAFNNEIDKKEQINGPENSTKDSIETINIDSDDNVVHEITDDDEPDNKKKKIVEIEKETLGMEIIDCEAMESCFVEEVNENIIEV